MRQGTNHTADNSITCLGYRKWGRRKWQAEGEEIHMVGKRQD